MAVSASRRKQQKGAAPRGSAAATEMSLYAELDECLQEMPQSDDEEDVTPFAGVAMLSMMPSVLHIATPNAVPPAPSYLPELAVICGWLCK